MAGIGRGKCAHLDWQTLRKENCQIDVVTDVAEKHSATLDAILVPTVTRDSRNAYRAGNLAHIDAIEMGQRPLAQCAEAAVVADPKRRAIGGTLAQRSNHGSKLLFAQGKRLLDIDVFARL